jgi:CxxC-x17-CxxC domain-containing protein
MQFTDQKIQCRVCHKLFVFSAGEQMFFHKQQFQNAPKTCRSCRLSGTRAKSDSEVSCAGCGETTRVPFVPRDGRSVYCRCCFDAHLAENSTPAAA